MNKKKYVVTIARQFGSMGRPIAMKLSEILGIEFYDRDIVDQAAEKLNLPVSIVDENEETAKELKNNYSHSAVKNPQKYRIKSLRPRRISLISWRKKKVALLLDGVVILYFRKWKIRCIFIFMHLITFGYSIVLMN